MDFWPILSGALLAQTIAVLSNGKLSSFSISKPNNMYDNLCHGGEFKEMWREKTSERNGGKISVIDDVLYYGRTITHVLETLGNKPIEATVIFKINPRWERLHDVPNKLKRYTQKLCLVHEEKNK
ncbi:MAG: hypothetical protein WC516_09100 [Patescibacteria group bacterium]